MLLPTAPHPPPMLPVLCVPLCCVCPRSDDLEGLRHFESHLATFREHLEVEVGKLTINAQMLTESKGWWDNAQQVGAPYFLVQDNPAWCVIRRPVRHCCNRTCAKDGDRDAEGARCALVLEFLKQVYSGVLHAGCRGAGFTTREGCTALAVHPV